MREIMHPAIALFLVTVICVVSLGIVNGITEEPVARQKLEARDKALAELLPQAQSFEETINQQKIGNIRQYYIGYEADEVVGHVIYVSPIGYSGAIEMMVAVAQDGSVAGVKIVSQSETPGLGSLAQEPEFLDKFKDKLGKFTVTTSEASKENEIEAITSSTITTKAVTAGVNDALDFWNEHLKHGGE